MLQLEEALHQLLSVIGPSPVETVPLNDALGRVLAEPLTARINLPPFDNSSMDGFAVRSTEVTSATRENPVSLPLQSAIVAGDSSREALKPGSCMRIFTGAPLPSGADAVVMQEDTDQTDKSKVLILDSVKPWENVRFAGEDIKAGAEALASGIKIAPGVVGLLSALGETEVRVHQRPRVSLLATGSELVEGGQTLDRGKIYESNRTTLRALALEAGAFPYVGPIVSDDFDQTVSALDKAFKGSDIVITSGGVSVGDLDLVKPAFEKLGGKINLWKVALKPGKPFVFGQLGNKILFGLPGNPVSAFVTFQLLVRPVLLAWQGAKNLELPRQNGVLQEQVSNRGDRRHFMRVRIDQDGKVRIAGTQGSHVLTSLAQANALLDVSPGSLLPMGTAVSVLRFS